MKNSKGFTLMELLVVVAIIGILSAIAYPSYQNSLIKGNRGNAKAFLMEVVQREQQYLMDNRSYAATAVALNLSIPPDFTKFYTLSVTVQAGPPPSFIATATPKAGRQFKDGSLSLTNNGVQTSQYPGKW